MGLTYITNKEIVRVKMESSFMYLLTLQIWSFVRFIHVTLVFPHYEYTIQHFTAK